MGNPGTTTRRKRKVKHRFYVPPSGMSYPDGGEPTASIDTQTTHHMRNVLRLSTGHVVSVFDNSGKEYEGEIVEMKPDRAKVKVHRAIAPQVESPLKVTLAQSLIKGNSFERLIALCTELGAARFVPVFSSRTEARLSRTRAADKIERWERIVQEASAQCGRVRVPGVDMPLDLKGLLSKKHEGAKIVLWERGGSGQLEKILEEEGNIEHVTLLAGPEGGFEQAEVKQAMEAGFHIWGLGPRTLRAETAGATAISLLQFAAGDMG